MEKKTFNKFLADYFADVVHDVQNYTITIALGKESLWSLIRNYIPSENDQNNIQNFLRIIENSNNKINDIAYLINAVRVFFEGKINIHNENVEFIELTEDVINKLNYKFSPSKYNVALKIGQTDSKNIFVDKESLRYLITMLIKILKAEKHGLPMILAVEKKQNDFVLELFTDGESKAYASEKFSNVIADFQTEKATDEDFLKFIHFFVINTIAEQYNGKFFVSKSGESYNGFKLCLRTQ
ncbi:MAG: hypothetical protein JW928_08275 [Candidatus Aureabacteria bacterium]|nr:hypothetical protein [Candidatus Auribacterota bacterium]